jgi:pimeloyl-ACP methyl ester carboxylesterase
VIVGHDFSHGLYTRVTAPDVPRGTILFIHGLGESGLCFEHLLGRDELAAWRLLVPDLVGYGRTPRDGRPRSLDDHVDDLVAWLDRRGEGQVIVLGHSMGGALAVKLAERHPDRVRLVIDVEGNTSPADCVYSGRAAALPLADFLDHGRTAMLGDIYRAGAADAAQRGYYASQRLCCPETFHLNSRELLARSEPEDLAQRRVALSIPLVYLAGAPGGASPRSRELLAAAGVDVREIRPSGHWPFIDRPDEFLGCLGDLLADLSH